MKKLLWLLLCASLVGLASCGKDDTEEVKPKIPENMETAFPDPIFREYVLTNFDKDKDGRISEAEALAVTKIEVRGTEADWKQGKGIASLQGVEYFTKLTYLDCYYNQLTELDVSRNTALDSLGCAYNRLTALDVSRNTALELLHCHSNQLTALDVSRNTALTDLWCNYNQLTALDVSRNTKLEELDCHSNQLTALDVSRNTKLEELDCYYNQLTVLDVSQNTALGVLHCNYNQLTALDVSRNTALTYLWCSNNQLTALDVSQNTKLDYLVCYYNQLTELDVSKTNLGDSRNNDEKVTGSPLDCAPMETLKTLYLKKGWSIKRITEDFGRSSDCIPYQTEIVFVD